MNSLARILAGLTLLMLAGFAATLLADDRVVRSRQLAEAKARQAGMERQRRAARLRWEHVRHRSRAHARMSDTLYASTPSESSTGGIACPVLVDENARAGGHYSDIPVLPTRWQSAVPSLLWQARSPSRDDVLSHLVQASDWTESAGNSKSASEDSRHVYLFPSASEPLREGIVRVINHSARIGEIRIDPVDDSGRKFDALTLAIGASETVHFNSRDLETGNKDKGLSGRTGAGQGSWRLAFSSDLDIEVLSYIRTADGFLTPMHDVAPAVGNIRRVAIFNPGSDRNQVSRLRLVNPGTETAEVVIRGWDDRGAPGAEEVTLSLDVGAAREIPAAQLEAGARGLDGRLGDGAGKWRLEVESEQPVVAMSLLESPTAHLTNLSTVPEERKDGMHPVPLFPAAGDGFGRQGFVRVINHSASAGEVRIHAYDETDWAYEPVTLAIGAKEAVHFSSADLEQGSPQTGLSGRVGIGEGDWRLELTSDLEIEVLAYIRTANGFLTAMHDVAPAVGNIHRVPMFNPGSNRNQKSLLRLVNPGEDAVAITVAGIDGDGAPGAGEVSLTVGAGASRTFTARHLEEGGDGLVGALGDGRGKWQLTVTAGAPVVTMSLLRSPTGHLTNLSTAPGRGMQESAGDETAEEAFRQSISPIVQSKCVNCHVQGGASGFTRLVFVTDSDANHLATNFAMLQTFLSKVEGAADLILNKIQGVGHGGGIQVAAGTDEYAAKERFLALLGEDVASAQVTVETLFDGVRMESWRSTLRRAAIVFAGRVPTAAEYASMRSADAAQFRAIIRNLMQGPGFHEFLIRSANDRLLTDRRLEDVLMGEGEGFYVDYSNKLSRLWQEGLASGDHREFHAWRSAVHYAAGRAPLELIAHVAENERPYTEILTANYVMANPQAAEAYGSATEFDDLQDSDEFRPSEIARYYRNDPSKIVKIVDDFRVIVEPGALSTEYPHAGILNTHAFLNRYPTTATNRNRARSRWTYYHFLGLDVEKSASRTTDPAALADTDNPTMRNPACTVCHSRLDPVAGAFQNYGDDGYYRDEGGGLDSLDGHYKEGAGSLQKIEVQGNTYETRQTFSQTVWLEPGTSLAIRHNQNNGCGEDGDQACGRDLRIDYFHIRDLQGQVVDRIDWSELDKHCEYDGEYNEEAGTTNGHYQWWGWSCHEIPTEVPEANRYVLEITVWADQSGDEATWFELGAPLYQQGDTWYRDMRSPGFDGELAPSSDNSLQWLANRIAGDARFAEATVKFWWPAIMGSEVEEPPTDQDDADFQGRLLASNAQTAEVKRLAHGFRHGFGGLPAYNLKDLLVEIVLSRWFRAESLEDADPVRVATLAHAGARRLLTPEELSLKTIALTGFDWQSWRSYWWEDLGRGQNWTNADWSYGLLYGGINSDGITKRGRDLTAVMAGVAKRHAMATACPVVMKDFYLVEDEDRRLFGGIDETITPRLDLRSVFEIAAESREGRETVALRGSLHEGRADVVLSFPNDFRAADGNYLDEEGRDRILRLDRLDIRNSADEVVKSVELETLEAVRDNFAVGEHFAMHDAGSVSVPVIIPAAGDYSFEVIAWGDRAGDELPKLWVTIETDTQRSAGSRAIKAKLAELHHKLLGVESSSSSPDVQAAFDLFVEVWDRRRDSAGGDFRGMRCDYAADQSYFESIAEDIWQEAPDEYGYPLRWDWERISELMEEADMADPHYVARTWVTVLAYLMMDYRYLHL